MERVSLRRKRTSDVYIFLELGGHVTLDSIRIVNYIAYKIYIDFEHKGYDILSRQTLRLPGETQMVPR
jgi:hypothetical protein